MTTEPIVTSLFGISAYHCALAHIENFREKQAVRHGTTTDALVQDIWHRLFFQGRLLFLAIDELFSRKPWVRLAKACITPFVDRGSDEQSLSSRFLLASQSAVAVTAWQVLIATQGILQPSSSTIFSTRQTLLETYFTYKSMVFSPPDDLHIGLNTRKALVQRCVNIAKSNPFLHLANISRQTFYDVVQKARNSDESIAERLIDTIATVNNLYVTNGWFSREEISNMSAAYICGTKTALLFFALEKATTEGDVYKTMFEEISQGFESLLSYGGCDPDIDLHINRENLLHYLTAFFLHEGEQDRYTAPSHGQRTNRRRALQETLLYQAFHTLSSEQIYREFEKKSVDFETILAQIQRAFLDRLISELSVSASQKHKITQAFFHNL